MTPAFAAPSIAPGFRDPVLDAQAAFRAVLDALAEPGRERAVAGIAEVPEPLGPVMAAVVAMLADYETPLWRDAALARSEIDAWLAFHTGAPIVEDPARAAIALIGDPRRLGSFADFALGTDVDPSTSTTLIVGVEGFDHGPRFRLAGPGIATSRDVSVAGAPADLARRLGANRALFPRGVDLILAGPTSVVGLPRTTRIEEIGRCTSR